VVRCYEHDLEAIAEIDAQAPMDLDTLFPGILDAVDKQLPKKRE